MPHAMLAPYQKYSCPNSNKWVLSHLHHIHNKYQENKVITLLPSLSEKHNTVLFTRT